MKGYIFEIIVPYAKAKRAKLKPNSNHQALAIADKFKGQMKLLC